MSISLECTDAQFVEALWAVGAPQECAACPLGDLLLDFLAGGCPVISTLTVRLVGNNRIFLYLAPVDPKVPADIRRALGGVWRDDPESVDGTVWVRDQACMTVFEETADA